MGNSHNMNNPNKKDDQEIYPKEKILEDETNRKEVQKLFKTETNVNNYYKNRFPLGRSRLGMDPKFLVNEPFWLDSSYSQDISFFSSYSLYGVDCYA